MKILQRKKIKSVALSPGDTLALYVGDELITTQTANREMDIDEIAVFNLDEKDIPGIRDGIGGAFLSSKKVK